MKTRGKFAVLIAVLVLLHGCAVLAPADDVTGTIQLERYSVAALDGLAIDGKTTLNDLATKLAQANLSPSQTIARLASPDRQENAMTSGSARSMSGPSTESTMETAG